MQAFATLTLQLRNSVTWPRQSFPAPFKRAHPRCLLGPLRGSLSSLTSFLSTPRLPERNMPARRQSRFCFDVGTRQTRTQRRVGCIPFVISLFLFGNACGISSTGPLKHTRSSLELSRTVSISGVLSNPRKRLRACLTCQSPLASASRSHAD
jgi:hypothetical protein